MLNYGWCCLVQLFLPFMLDSWESVRKQQFCSFAAMPKSMNNIWIFIVYFRCNNLCKCLKRVHSSLYREFIIFFWKKIFFFSHLHFISQLSDLSLNWGRCSERVTFWATTNWNIIYDVLTFDGAALKFTRNLLVITEEKTCLLHYRASVLKYLCWWHEICSVLLTNVIVINTQNM